MRFLLFVILFVPLMLAVPVGEAHASSSGSTIDVSSGAGVAVAVADIGDTLGISSGSSTLKTVRKTMTTANKVLGFFGLSFSTGNAVADVLCEVTNWFTGPIGEGIATLAVIVLGLGALLGKVTYGMALTTGVGIATIFGAPEILYEITGYYACFF